MLEINGSRHMVLRDDCDMLQSHMLYHDLSHPRDSQIYNQQPKPTLSYGLTLMQSLQQSQ
ncbi:hypothetical protein N7478_001935 [Penicillium angulare]|uniref:uncharacterized protein n=1 Tax=Penicillium angulare TaxID=116970 RepID=UPI00254145AA|nr:uncharacterized protein N7478_001935 [Penicillium angulare]KAJ5288905.1 hypothetical protein N7478_001935 [Penicillium angulare]